MGTEPTRTGATTAAGAGTSTPVATAPPGGGLPPAAGTAAVTIAQRRVSDIGQGGVIALPDDVFVPVTARDGERRTWAWHSTPSRQLTNAHRWRWVYDLDQHVADETGLADSLPRGFRLLRVSDDHPDQDQEYRSRVLAVRELDLVDVQVQPTEPDRPPSGQAADTGPDADGGARTADVEEFRARDAVLRVFDRSTDAGSDDASDMYVFDVFDVSVLVRLRTTRTHPATRPQLYLHIDNEDREPTDLAVEVSNGGEAHYRI